MPKPDEDTFEIDDELDEDQDDKEGDKDKGESKEDDEDTLEGVQFGDDDEDEDDESAADDKEDKESKDDKDDKKKDEEPTEFEKRIEKQEKQIKNLNIALHGLRQEKQKAKEEKGEPALTETQLTELFKEHKDDPDTLYSLVSYMVKQGSKTAQDNAVDATEISQRKKELDTGIVEAFPDLAQEDSELRTDTNKTIKSMRLEDHPYKDFLAISAMVHKDLEGIKNYEYERGKKEALASNADASRKKKAKETNLSPPGGGGLKNKSGKMNTNMEDVAKRLGLSKRGRNVYQQLVKKAA